MPRQERLASVAAESRTQSAATATAATDAHPVLALQRKVGNRAVVGALADRRAEDSEGRPKSALSPTEEEQGRSLGPFLPSVNSLLHQAFGPSVGVLPAARREDAPNRALGAVAHARGRQISLSSSIREDPEDANSMAVIAHEVAHALAPNAPRFPVDRPGDLGELAAERAGAEMRAWVSTGRGGVAPMLEPARGGQTLSSARGVLAQHAALSGEELLLPGKEPGLSKERPSPHDVQELGFHVLLAAAQTNRNRLLGQFRKRAWGGESE